MGETLLDQIGKHPRTSKSSHHCNLDFRLIHQEVSALNQVDTTHSLLNEQISRFQKLLC